MNVNINKTKLRKDYKKYDEIIWTVISPKFGTVCFSLGTECYRIPPSEMITRTETLNAQIDKTKSEHYQSEKYNYLINQRKSD